MLATRSALQKHKNRGASCNASVSSNNNALWRLGVPASWRLGVPTSWRPGVLASWRPGVLASWRLGVLRRHQKKEKPPRREAKKKPAASYSRTGESRTTLGDGALNFRVRNGNGCDNSSMATGKKPFSWELKRLTTHNEMRGIDLTSCEVLKYEL